MADDSTYPHLLSAVGFGGGAQTNTPMGGMDAPGAMTNAPGGAPAQPQGQAPQGNYSDWASQAGFAGAQGAGQIESTKRKLAAAQASLALKGEQERLGINTGMEDRGFFNSGQRLVGLAKQQGAEASQGAELQAGAADDIANINAQMQQAMAQNQIQQQQQAQSQTLFNQQSGNYTIQHQLAEQQLQQQSQQFAAEMALARRRLELQNASAQGNY